MNIERAILATLASVGAGVLIGILVAPEKGKETRKKISQKSNGYLKDLRKGMDKTVKEAKEGLREFSKKGKEIAEEAEEEIKERTKNKS